MEALLLSHNPIGEPGILAIAGALVMYDRLISLEGFPLRPVMPGAEPAPLPEHVRGALKQRSKEK